MKEKKFKKNQRLHSHSRKWKGNVIAAVNPGTSHHNVDTKISHVKNGQSMKQKQNNSHMLIQIAFLIKLVQKTKASRDQLQDQLRLHNHR